MQSACRPLLAAFAGAMISAAPALAKPAMVSSGWHAETLAIWKKLVSIPSVRGRGQVPVVARYIADTLEKGGFAAGDVTIEGSGDDTTLVARYRGTGSGKALLLSGHMDVVEARASDWQRDPFIPIEENGFLYGRGTLDIKIGDAQLVSTFLQLKREGFRPVRDIVMLLSGDEETDMATTARLAAKYAAQGAVLLNADAGGGLLDEKGKPVAFRVQAAEKTYADFEISVTDPGGHSSRPGATNAIYVLAQAIDRIAAYQFPPQVSELTRTYFRTTGKHVGGTVGAAMIRFADDPTDAAAIATLRADPEYVGQIGTTCVATMLSGGHALNALPQRASVSVNCRIFPGVSIDSVKATLDEVIANPRATVTTIGTPVSSDGSPLDPRVMQAVRRGIDLSYPGLTIVPQMDTGASDSLYFRAAGVPSYGVGWAFIRPEDDFSHGLNERAPLATIDPGLLLWRSMLIDLSK